MLLEIELLAIVLLISLGNLTESTDPNNRANEMIALSKLQPVWSLSSKVQTVLKVCLLPCGYNTHIITILRNLIVPDSYCICYKFTIAH
jgi:hypothetical protein